MRVRTKTGEPQIVPVSWFGGDNAAKPQTNAGSYQRTSSKRMEDQVNPGFFRASREGTLLPVAPMTMVSKDHILTAGSWDLTAWYHYPAAPQWDERYYLVGSGLLNSDSNPKAKHLELDPDFVDIALQEGLGRARSRAFDALTFLAELNKTIDMVITLRTRANHLMETFVQRCQQRRRTKTGKALASAELFQQVWLEMRYGWRPILYDMMSIQELLSTPRKELNTLYRGYGTKADESTDSTTTTTGYFSTPAFNASLKGFLNKTVVTTTASASVHASVGVHLDEGSNIQLDPLQTAWELIPFSFVLDWFVNIGSVLQAFSPFANVDNRFSCYTIEQRYERSQVTVPRVNTADGAIASGSVNPGTDLFIETRRSRILAPVTPNVGFDVELNLAKVIDLIALAVPFRAGVLKKLSFIR